MHIATESRKRKNERARQAKERWIKSRADLALFVACPLIVIGIVFPSAPTLALSVVSLLGFAGVGMKIVATLESVGSSGASEFDRGDG